MCQTIHHFELCFWFYGTKIGMGDFIRVVLHRGIRRSNMVQWIWSPETNLKPMWLCFKWMLSVWLMRTDNQLASYPLTVKFPRLKLQGPSRMKLTKGVSAHICLLCISFDHVTVSLLNMRKYALASTDWTWTTTCALIIGGSFMGHLAKSAVTTALGKNSAIDVKYNFYPLQCRQRSYWLRRSTVGRRFRTLPAKLYTNTNVPRNNWWPIHDQLQELGVSPQQLNKCSTSFVFSFTEIVQLLLLDLGFDFSISLWSIVINSSSNETSLWGPLSLWYRTILIHSNCLRSLAHGYAVTNSVLFLRIRSGASSLLCVHQVWWVGERKTPHHTIPHHTTPHHMHHAYTCLVSFIFYWPPKTMTTKQ